MTVSPNAVFRWLRHRWWAVLVVAVFFFLGSWLAKSALDASQERKASRDRIETSASEARDLSRQVKDQNVLIAAQAEDIKRALMLIESATSEEAQKRGAANLAFAISELRRSIDCAAFYFAGERPPACAEVAGRLDAIRSGRDPFPKPLIPGGVQ